MKLVKAMKTYGHIRVSNAMSEIRWRWKNPRRAPTNIERMVGHLPRIELEQILSILRRDWIPPVPTETLTSKHFVSR